MAEERKFIEDKVYLQGPNGVIYDYEPLLANQAGFVAVTPNKSKATLAAEKSEAQAAEEQAAADKATQEKLAAEAKKATDAAAKVNAPK